METNESIRVKLVDLGWVEVPNVLIETVQKKSYWHNNDKLGVHLLLVEDLTPSLTEPNLFLYTERDRWREIKIGDITE